MSGAAELRIPDLHLGPMSGNVISAIAAFAEAQAWPICLIASRRQIDCDVLGGGYVDGLSTERFAQNLRHAVSSGNIILARDHGGPYQRNEEEGLSLDAALDRVELSYRMDIASGFSILHIDPEKCIKPGDANGLKQFTELTQELLGRCFRILEETGRENVRFEVGSDEGIGMEFMPDQWAAFLDDIQTFCEQHGRPQPTAIAVPLGTKVKEIENVGGFALNPLDPFWTKRVQTMQEVAACYGVKLKLHNADYTSAEVLKRYKELGVGQINVAPELGVLETQALLAFLRAHSMQSYAEQFLGIAYRSRKWERWLKADSQATDEDKAVIAGHYVFATPECRALMETVRAQPAAETLDAFLIDAITKGIKKYYSVLEEETYAPLQHVSA